MRRSIRPHERAVGGGLVCRYDDEVTDPAGEKLLHVAIIEDDRTVRDGLAALIDGTVGYRCVGRYASVEQALQATQKPAPGVILLDINLPGIPGSVGVRLLKERLPSTEVLMLTVYAEQDK